MSPSAFLALIVGAVCVGLTGGIVLGNFFPGVLLPVTNGHLCRGVSRRGLVRQSLIGRAT